MVLTKVANDRVFEMTHMRGSNCVLFTYLVKTIIGCPSTQFDPHILVISKTRSFCGLGQNHPFETEFMNHRTVWCMVKSKHFSFEFGVELSVLILPYITRFCDSKIPFQMDGFWPESQMIAFLKWPIWGVELCTFYIPGKKKIIGCQSTQFDPPYWSFQKRDHLRPWSEPSIRNRIWESQNRAMYGKIKTF